MKRKAYKHQVSGQHYCEDTAHPALFWEMRVAKSLPVIRSLANHSKVLVVTSFSAFYDWAKELRLEGEEDVTTLTGTKAQRLKKIGHTGKWTIHNHDGWRGLPALADEAFDAVVFDESDRLCNPRAQLTKFYIRVYREAKRFILSGTPAEDLLGYYCPFRFLHDELPLGCKNFYEFRNKYFLQSYYKWVPYKKRIHEVHKFIEANSSRLTRADVGFTDDKVYKTRLCKLPSDAAKAYQQAQEEFYLEYKGHTKFTKHILSRAHMLAQLAGGFIDGEVVHKAKFELLTQLLGGQLRNSVVIVYCQYRAEIEFIKEVLGADVDTMHGGSDREAVLDRFNLGKTHILVCQQQAVTYGANLSRADTTIYFSNNLRGIIRKQTEDRMISLNDRRTKLVIDLMAADTVDVAIYEGLMVKESDADLLRRILNSIGGNR